MRGLAILFLSLALSARLAAAEPSIADAIQRIQTVGKEGIGNKEAGLAWKSIVAAGNESLLPILNGFEGSNAVARNWLSTAIDAILEKSASNAGEPIKILEAYVMDVKKGPASRRLAYDQLKQLDAKAPERILPKMLDDRAVDIRREAIAAQLTKLAEAKIEGDAAKKAYADLFAYCRDEDQVEVVVKKLKEFGIEKDLQKHFGVVADWQLLGPFDSQEGKAYSIALEPEKSYNLATKYKGKDGADLAWKPVITKDNYGKLDLNKELGKFKFAVAYAFTNVISDKEQTVDIRFGSTNAIRLFLNGKELFEREEYHHGQKHDQYTVKATLKAGSNDLLVKLLQNNQTEPWAQQWSFQLRICDDTGKALGLKTK